MAGTTLPGVLLTGNHASRPAATAVATGTLYSCTTHSLVYQSDGATWSTWATITGGLSDPMTTRGDIIVRNASNTTARLGVGSSGQVLSSDGTDVSWATPASGSDPTIPAGGTLYSGTSTSGWSSFGSPDTFDANSTIAGAFYLAKTSMGTNNLVGATRSCSSFPRTYTMKILDGLLHVDFHAGGLCIGEAGNTGKFVEWGYVHDGGLNRPNRRRPWTTASSGGSDTTYDASGASPGPPYWYRLVVNSSTDVEFWQSRNGYIYHQYAAAVNPGFTIAVFGFCMSTFSAISHKIAVDWIHES